MANDTAFTDLIHGIRTNRSIAWLQEWYIIINNANTKIIVIMLCANVILLLRKEIWRGLGFLYFYMDIGGWNIVWFVCDLKEDVLEYSPLLVWTFFSMTICKGCYCVHHFYDGCFCNQQLFVLLDYLGPQTLL